MQVCGDVIEDDGIEIVLESKETSPKILAGSGARYGNTSPTELDGMSGV